MNFNRICRSFYIISVRCFLGVIAGYFGGWIDRVIMWLINITWSISTLLIVKIITLALGRGFWQVFVNEGLTVGYKVPRFF